MPTQREFDDLKALVERIAAGPKVKPYLDGDAWPRTMSRGEGTISSGLDDLAKFDQAHPKDKHLLGSERAVEEAQVVYDSANAALLAASREESGRFVSYIEGGGTLQGSPVVVDVVPQPLVSIRTDVPEFAARLEAERRLITAKTKLFGLQRKRDAERREWELRRNPVLNPSKKDGLVRRVVKMANGR
jgi:hypothetical protein